MRQVVWHADVDLHSPCLRFLVHMWSTRPRHGRNILLQAAVDLTFCPTIGRCKLAGASHVCVRCAPARFFSEPHGTVRNCPPTTDTRTACPPSRPLLAHVGATTSVQGLRTGCHNFVMVSTIILALVLSYALQATFQGER